MRGCVVSGLPLLGDALRARMMLLKAISRLPRPRDLAIWPLLFALLPLACSRPAGPRSDDGGEAGQHRVPFKEGASTPDAHPDDASSAQNKTLRHDSGLPFRDAESLPAGTLLTVRLKNPIAAEHPDASKVFAAVVDEAVLVEGNELVPRGASVAGRIESSGASELTRNRGYVRLTLDSINLDGRELPIQTSSLFVRARADQTQALGTAAVQPVVRLEGGRRLTFRLTEPVSVAIPLDTAVH
jgi:hypothetical protein